MLAKGTLVEVFEDPLTMVRKEGNATIVEHVIELEPGVDQYRVNFFGDDPRTIVVRTIAEKPAKVEVAHWVGSASSPLRSAQHERKKHQWVTCVGCGRKIILGETGIETRQGNKCTKCARARRRRGHPVVVER